MSARKLKQGLPIASVLLGLLAFAVLAQVAPTSPMASRGELLYARHCLACHTSQVYWRANRQASDWPSLKAEVQRWQASDRLDWSEEDILGVTHYLNERFYHFTAPVEPVGAL